MVCSISCAISFVFIVGMLYFYNATHNNKTIIEYKKQLNSEQREAYDKIAKERLHISLQGYVLGFVFSLIIIFYYYENKRIKPAAVVCLVLATSCLTNYFYYMLMPKSDWLLNHVESKAQTQSWLNMYRAMQYYYHAGLVLGIMGVGVLAYAFRC
jgi:hypothetical protein